MDSFQSGNVCLKSAEPEMWHAQGTESRPSAFQLFGVYEI